MMTSQEIRQSFFDFFESKRHKIVPSAPMVIKDDPTLMFTNAGMNQFKNIILGNDPITYPRVANSQKCLRVSGKHNDLEEVGHDTYHHTMFEMLGNWSFGDYFKEEAIEWAWEYLTEIVKIDKNRLYVTIFEGSPSEGLERDEEAAQIWEKFLPKERIINGNKKDNFWEMGDTGPCGPCSEIHVDLRTDYEREKIDGSELINKDHPQVIEIWNNVFMQFNRKGDGTLTVLPAKVIDTGMGFERLCMTLQSKTSNYDTDIFQPIIHTLEEISGKKYGDTEKVDIAMRVIADHVRTIAFSIADGQLPSNAKAGYVIRRILRRAVRYGYTFLNQHNAFMYKLIDSLCEVMGKAYPEIVAQKTLIEKVIKEEEESFLRTLETGIKLLEKSLTELKSEGKTILSGHIAFTLYDTYGFPLDLTELILRENNIIVDMEGFNAEMQQQKERARNAAVIETSDWIILQEGESHFVGYDTDEIETSILRYRKIVQKGKTFFQIVLKDTPFYAEMGGQVGDSGTLKNSEESILVIDTKKENNLSVHIVNQLPKNLSSKFLAKIDIEKRLSIARNHSATHLIHEALREVLGTHVEQKGSYVSAENLRFDFAHFQKMTKEELRSVEQIVNKRIRMNFSLNEIRETPIKDAQKMGAMALFGEKYGETVRVIRFGDSVELCGGTHVKATGEIGMVKIVSESSIAAGIRRIEAISGGSVENMIYKFQDFINDARELFNNVPDLSKAIQKTITENAELHKKVENFMHEKIITLRDKFITTAKDENGVKVIRLKTELPNEAIKTLMFQIKNKIFESENSISTNSLLIVIGNISEGKPSLTVLLSDDLVNKGHSAVNLTRNAAKLIQGGGGGQPHFATAGGKNIDKLDEAINSIVL